jgi:ribosomal protein S27AE
MARTTKREQVTSRRAEIAEPVTEYDSKMVMLRAERHDNISISNVVNRIRQAEDIPSNLTVVRRTTPYFGPKLVLASSSDRNYMITAPGPDSHLLLWSPIESANGDREGWTKLAEVEAKFIDDQPKYDLCPECGEPMQTLEHERKAAVGRCPGTSFD